jgi:hypothetical protein
MQYVAKNPVWKMSFIDSFLTALQTVPGAALIGATPKIHLFTGALNPSPTNVIADFTAIETSFTGYAAPALGIYGLHFNMGNNIRGALATGTFVLTGTAVTAVANGYWVDAGASPDWIVAERFPTPFPFAYTGDFLAMELALALSLKTVLQ